MTYSLPESLTVNERDYAICSDFRRALEIMEMLEDPELSDEEKALLVLDGIYQNVEAIPQDEYGEALQQAVWFLDGGVEHEETNGPKLMSWEQDFQYIVSPVNRIMGQDVRGMKHCHWWTFLSAWQEIGDCMFAQIVNIRQKKAKGKKLDKGEREFYEKNRKAIDLKRRYTASDDDIVDRWSGK